MKIPPELVPWLNETGVYLGWLALVILVDFVAGVAVAIRQGAFNLERIPDFLRHYGPLVLIWLSLRALTLLPPEFEQFAGIVGNLSLGAYIVIFAGAVGSILGHAQALGVLKSGIMARVAPATDQREAVEIEFEDTVG